MLLAGAAAAAAGRRWRESPDRVLLVVPHPDDESYGCSGTLQRLVARTGTAVVCLVLTSGEAATVGRERGIPPAELARIREQRLARIRDRLGLGGLLLARLPDGGLARLSLAELATVVRTGIELVAPQVVLGHDPRGVNAHPDHIAAHWGLRRALEGSPVRRFGMLAHDAESAESAAPRLLFPTHRRRIHWTVELTPEEIRGKERCLEEHEAIITLDPRVAAEGDRTLRPPREQWEFFGEADGVVRDDLFAALPQAPLPV